MVTLSTLPSGSLRARTTSGNPLMSLSRTAAWLYSWKASALTFMALASASPFLKMISASASPCARMAEARPSASLISRWRSALAFAARDLGFLHLHLSFAFDLLDAHRLLNNSLLHDVGLDFVRLVRGGLRLLGHLQITGFLDV